MCWYRATKPGMVYVGFICVSGETSIKYATDFLNLRFTKKGRGRVMSQKLCHFMGA